MGKIDDLIREKLVDIERLKHEISALKIAAPLLDDFAAARPQDDRPGKALDEIQ
jgi:hypothetical protein